VPLLKKKVISTENLATPSPLQTGLVWWLVFDRFHVPAWVWGVAGTILAVLAIAWIASIWTETSAEVTFK
jgi:hypothetical protein